MVYDHIHIWKDVKNLDKYVTLIIILKMSNRVAEILSKSFLSSPYMVFADLSAVLLLGGTCMYVFYH